MKNKSVNTGARHAIPALAVLMFVTAVLIVTNEIWHAFGLESSFHWFSVLIHVNDPLQRLAAVCEIVEVVLAVLFSVLFAVFFLNIRKTCVAATAFGIYAVKGLLNELFMLILYLWYGYGMSAFSKYTIFALIPSVMALIIMLDFILKHRIWVLGLIAAVLMIAFSILPRLIDYRNTIGLIAAIIGEPDHWLVPMALEVVIPYVLEMAIMVIESAVLLVYYIFFAGKNRKSFVADKRREEFSDTVRKYAFYGSGSPAVAPVDPAFSGIRDQRHLYDILSELWCSETCAPRMRDKWSEENRTLGQCSITAFLAQDIFGGKVYGVPLPDGNFHCYNVVGESCFDLTSEQFEDEKLDYTGNPEQSRDAHFTVDEKRERYLLLKERLLEALARQ
jgi:hypothetical protein